MKRNAWLLAGCLSILAGVSQPAAAGGRGDAVKFGKRDKDDGDRRRGGGDKDKDKDRDHKAPAPAPTP
ncbi:MAG: hypothetical protein ACHQ51_02760, partial [Elusimicrobiota bacterium]